jgi:MOSC domain-containing protein YiiM
MSPTQVSSTPRTGRVVAVCTSPGGIPKLPLAECAVGPDGLAGDAHDHEKHVKPERAVCVQDAEMLEQLRAEGYALTPGATGENLLLEGLGVGACSPGQRLHFAGGVVLELVAPRKPCYVLDAIDPRLKDVIVGRCGYMARVITGGVIRPREEVHLDT